MTRDLSVEKLLLRCKIQYTECANFIILSELFKTYIEKAYDMGYEQGYDDGEQDN